MFVTCPEGHLLCVKNSSCSHRFNISPFCPNVPAQHAFADITTDIFWQQREDIVLV